MVQKRNGALESNVIMTTATLEILSNDNQTLNEYIYEPLDIKKTGSIRLLKVLDAKEDQIQCSLVHACVSKAKYYALSYSWGPPGDERIITVNGQAMRIRRNLFDFLHRITHKPILDLSTKRHSASNMESSRTLFFWIDAICLDQTNVEERNHQVQQMYRIYNRAEAVLAWLGSGDTQIEEWFRELEIAAKNDQRTSSLFKARPHSILYENARKDFLHLDFWSRLWITQEIGLASEVFILYSDQLIPWFLFWEEIACNREIVDSPAHFHHDVRLRKRVRKSVVSFASLLESAKHLKCADPRDRIYGLLALDEGGPKFRVDYSETVPQLAARFALFHKGKDSFLLGPVLRALSIEPCVRDELATPVLVGRNNKDDERHYCLSCLYQFPIYSKNLAKCSVICGRLLQSSGHIFYLHQSSIESGKDRSWFGPLINESEYQRLLLQVNIKLPTLKAHQMEMQPQGKVIMEGFGNGPVYIGSVYTGRKKLTNIRPIWVDVPMSPRYGEVRQAGVHGYQQPRNSFEMRPYMELEEMPVLHSI